MSGTRAMMLLADLQREIRDQPAPVGQDELRSDLEEALNIIDRLLGHLDQTTPDEKWIDSDGNPAPAVRDWMMLKCFGSDHDLYDDIHALRGRRGRKWRFPASRIPQEDR